MHHDPKTTGILWARAVREDYGDSEYRPFVGQDRRGRE